MEIPNLLVPTGTTVVPNRFPTRPTGPRKIALIGEAPGADEERRGQPFVGASGRFLAALLSRCGVSIDSCFVGNVSQHRPPANDISTFRWDGPEITHGLERLHADLLAFEPNVCVLLGNVPLKAALDPGRVHPLFGNAFRHKNADYRGSVLTAEAGGPFHNRKVIASYHPAYVLRMYEHCPLLQFDLQRAVNESTFPHVTRTKRHLIIPTSVEETLMLLDTARIVQAPVACDIEGYWNAISCMSFAQSGERAFIVPFTRKDGSRVWSQHDEIRIWVAMAALLEDTRVPKVLQNSLYDRFCLHYGYGIRVRNVADDTMLQWWELYAELPKKLSVQTSILTDQPYYKHGGKSEDDRTFYEYCCLDSCVTKEISEKLTAVLPSKAGPTAVKHYELNRALLNPLLYMEVRGIRYDALGAAQRRSALRTKLHEAQARLNGLTGRWLPSMQAVFDRVRAEKCFVKADVRTWPDLRRYAKKAHVEEIDRLVTLVTNPDPTLATIGEVEDIAEISLNTASPKQFNEFLYEELKLPVQYKTDKTTGVKSPTGDYEALLRLAKHCTRTDQTDILAILHLCIEIRSLDTRQQMLSIGTDSDGRVRCGYNVVGSETGRVQCYTSPTGSGYALQTIPNYTDPALAPGGVLGDRDLFLSDNDMSFFQCDLKGADGWTVAAYAALLGDPTMLNDYRSGISPFDILTLRLRGVEGDYRNLDWLREARKAVGKEDWDRFAMKRVQHGGSYLEGGPTISTNILKDSEGKMFLEPAECKRIRDEIFFARYPGIRAWHNWVAARLRERPQLVAASGQVRKFFGRPDEILTQAVAFEPQANTTYVTNLALYRLWTDPRNRTPDGRLIIEPLHQVHDALCGQFPTNRTEWALGLIREWFNNPVTIAGQSILIPFDGEYGPAWGLLGPKHGGGKI